LPSTEIRELSRKAQSAEDTDHLHLDQARCVPRFSWGGEEAIMASEERWVNATSDLFGYALEHADKLSVKGQAVLVSDGQVKAHFERKLRDAQERFDALQAQRALLLELQKGVMGRLGGLSTH
jgi:hypothetical protein